VLLAQVVEELTGRPFVDVVQERVFAVAGMSDSGFFRLDEAVPDVAVGYLPRSSPAAPWRSNIYRVPVVGGGDGGAWVTARDADRFLTALDDGTLLGPLRDLALQRHGWRGASPWGYGYGVWLLSDGSLAHDGGDPGVEALLRRWPQHDTNLVILCSTEGVCDDITEEALRALGLAEHT
jgi:CubicO group peptidase (beta-lactamase class C family)